MLFGSNDIGEESAANSILIIPPKNKEALNALDTIWWRLQYEGADKDTFSGFKKQLQESTQNSINKLLLRSILRDWNNVAYD